MNDQHTESGAAVAPITEPTATDAQEALREYIELDRRYSSEIKPFLEKYSAAKTKVFEATSFGHFFQDDDGIVYKVDKKEWTSVRMEPVEIKRTRREGETKGSLSMTEARDAGFVVEGK